MYGLIEQLVQNLKFHSKSADTPYNLASGHIFVLSYLYRETKCRSTDIARILGITSGAVTGLTDKLTAHGLIERHRPEDDRRVVQLSLTEQGRETVEVLRSRRVKWFTELLGHSDESGVDEIVDGIKRLLRLFDQKQTMGE
jgi:DNA-binding MarR family transcriptional regulator